MKKFVKLFALLSMAVFLSSCKQNQTNAPKDNIKSNSAGYSESELKEADTTKVPMGMVRNVKLARNGDILIASYLGVFRYDGTSFTNLKKKRFSEGQIIKAIRDQETGNDVMEICREIGAH